MEAGIPVKLGPLISSAAHSAFPPHGCCQHGNVPPLMASTSCRQPRASRCFVTTMLTQQISSWCLVSRRRNLCSSTRSDCASMWSLCPTLRLPMVARSPPRCLPAKRAMISAKTSHGHDPFPCAPGIDRCGSSLCKLCSWTVPPAIGLSSLPSRSVVHGSPCQPFPLGHGVSLLSLVPFANIAPLQPAGPNFNHHTRAPEPPITGPVHAASPFHQQVLSILLQSATIPTTFSFCSTQILQPCGF